MTWAVVLAAGRGRRMGADKALVRFGDETALERVLRVCREGGIEAACIVRAEGAADLPVDLPVTVSIRTVPTGLEMLDSVRAGLAAVPDDVAAALVFPVDYAMVEPSTVRAVVDELADGAAIVLPLHEKRPGHPVGLARSVFVEVHAATTSLRDVIAADASRVRVVPVVDPWVHRDLDTPDQLAAARVELDRRGRR